MPSLRQRIEVLERRNPREMLDRAEASRREAVARLLDALRNAFPEDERLQVVPHGTRARLEPIAAAKTHEGHLKALALRIRQEALTEHDRATLALMEADAATLGMTAAEFAIMDAASFDKF